MEGRGEGRSFEFWVLGFELGEKERIGFGVLKRISNIQHQCPMAKFEDEGGPGDRETMNWSD